MARAAAPAPGAGERGLARVGLALAEARELVGYSILQCLVHLPLVFALMSLFAQTPTYHPPVFP